MAELRERRDRLAGDVATHERARRDVEGRRARAEAAISLGERRVAESERALATLADRERAAGDERDIVSRELAASASREAAARDELEALLADDRAERARLAEAERDAMAARERLRSADDRARASDVSALEARLNLDSLREQLLVELAGLGEVGLRHLARAAGVAVGDLSGVCRARPGRSREGAADALRDPGTDAEPETEGVGSAPAEAGETAALEAALDLLAPRWADGRRQWRPALARPAGHAASPVPRARRREPVRRRRVPGRPRAPRDARRPGQGPARGHRQDPGADRRPRRVDRHPVPGDLRGPRGRLRRPVPAAVRRWLRQALAHRPDRPVRHGHRDHRAPAGQEAAGAVDAVGWRARSDGRRAAVRDARGSPCALLRARRGRRRARRGERRTLHGGAAGARRPNAVHRHHPQPRHDRGRRCPLRGHRRRRFGEPRDQPPPRRGAGHRQPPPHRGPPGPRGRPGRTPEEKD